MQQTIDHWNPPSVPTRMPGENLNDFVNRLQQHLALQQGLLIQYTRQVTNQINTATQGAGPPIPAAATISPTAYQHVVTGSGTIMQINVTPRFAGGQLVLSAQDGFSLGTGGNISTAKAIPANGATVLNYNSTTKMWVPVGP